MQDLIIAVGLNENVETSRNPNVPITPSELARDAKECVDAGASVLHLHLRHAPPSAEAYTEVWDALEGAGVDVPVYMGTLTGRGVKLIDGRLVEIEASGYAPVEQMAARSGNRLEIGPVAPGSVDWYPCDDRETILLFLRRTIEDATFELEAMKRLDLWASVDIWEPGNLRMLFELERRGLFHRPMLIKFFMSDFASYGLPAEPRYLDVFLSMLPEHLDCEWMVLPRGVTDTAAKALWRHAITLGGNVRVGIGDNPGSSGDRFPATNAARVEEMVNLARELGREVATPAAVRSRFAAGPARPSVPSSASPGSVAS